MAAVLMQSLNMNSSPSATCNKAMEVFVNSKVPTIKFKELLLPPAGSVDRARRHFQESMASSDKLVAALAAERDFLCGFVERQCAPPPKKGKTQAYVETPHHALLWLRAMFRSLSQRFKKASTRNEAELALIHAWYSDHMLIANSYCQQELADATVQILQKNTITPSFMDAAPGKRRKLDNTQGSARDESHVTLKSADGLNYEIPKYAANWFKPGVAKEQAMKIHAANAQSGSLAFRMAFKKICRNCWLLGRGPRSHAVPVRYKQGNPCALLCPKCQAKRWVQDCKQ